MFWFYAFIAPFFLQFAIFRLFPMGWSFWLSFHEWQGIGSMSPVGLANYAKALHDPLFWQSIYNTMFLCVIGTIITLSVAFLIAFIINSGYVRFKNFFKTAYFLPQVTSAVVIGILFQVLYGKEYGFLNWIINGMLDLKPDWLGKMALIKPSIIAASFWGGFGFYVVMCLAGLQGIDPELYEAARVDGAGIRQQFLHITIPMMRNVLVFLVIMSFIGGLQRFDMEYMLVGANGGTGNAGLTIVMYLYQQGFGFFNLGYGSALAWLLFLMIITGTLLQVRFVGLSRK